MAITFNAIGITNDVKPAINRGKSNLIYSRDIISTINIPADFIYRTQLINFPSDIRNIETKTDNVNKWLDGVVSGFTNADTSSLNVMNQLISSITGFNLASNQGATGATVTNRTVTTMATNTTAATPMNNSILNMQNRFFNGVYGSINATGAQGVSNGYATSMNMGGIRETGAIKTESLFNVFGDNYLSGPNIEWYTGLNGSVQATGAGIASQITTVAISPGPIEASNTGATIGTKTESVSGSSCDGLCGSFGKVTAFSMEASNNPEIQKGLGEINVILNDYNGQLITYTEKAREELGGSDFFGGECWTLTSSLIDKYDEEPRVMRADYSSYDAAIGTLISINLSELSYGRLL